MRNPGFFKLAELVNGGTLLSTPHSEGIPYVNHTVTPAGLGNAAAGHSADLLKQYPGIIGDVGHAITDAAPFIKPMLPTIKSFAGHPIVQNVIRGTKGLVAQSPRIGMGISGISGVNRLVKGDRFGAALDGLSGLAGYAATRSVPYAGQAMLLADGLNIYRDMGMPGLHPGMDYKNISTPGMVSGGTRRAVDSPSTPTSGPLTPPQPYAPVGTRLISGGASATVPSVKPTTAQPAPSLLPAPSPTIPPGVPIKQAFVRGIWKRAEQLGLEKEAFIAPLLAGAIDIAGSIGGAHLLTKGLGRLAAMKNMGAIGKGAKKFYNWTQSPGTTMGPLVGNMAMMTASDMATRPVLSPIKRMLGLEQPEAPQYQ
jgi:hypothetical protein